MRYIGSKNRLSKELAPIIQSYITSDTVGYKEPFVGGANMIDKIKCTNKTGHDIHEELIALLKHIQETTDDIPERILEDEYKKVKENKTSYPKWYVGLVGFCGSFGAKYFGGYARDSRNDNSGNWSAGAIRNLKKQAPNLKDIHFSCCDFRDLPIEKFKNYVIYCDIPYKDTTAYKTKNSTKNFPYEDFYEWCKVLSKDNTVLISEYNMPEGFECIWQKETVSFLGSGVNTHSDKNRTEKLFICKSTN